MTTTLLLLVSLQVFQLPFKFTTNAPAFVVGEDRKPEPSVSEFLPAYALMPESIDASQPELLAGQIVRHDAETAAGQAFPDLGRYPHDWLDPGLRAGQDQKADNRNT